MVKYRVIGSDGEVERTFVCDTDENAIEWAKRLMAEQPAELWSGGAAGRSPYPSREKTGREPRNS
jgi:hypothetical protein